MKTKTKNPDRVDFKETENGTIIIKFWLLDGHYVPSGGADVKPPDFDLEGAVIWLEGHGYTIRRWPGQGGARREGRAWKGSPQPLRTRAQIKKRRNEVEQLTQRGYFGDTNVLGLDFAYDM